MFDYQCFTKFKSAQKRCIGLYTVDSSIDNSTNKNYFK